MSQTERVERIARALFEAEPAGQAQRRLVGVEAVPRRDELALETSADEPLDDETGEPSATESLERGDVDLRKAAHDACRVGGTRGDAVGESRDAQPALEKRAFRRPETPPDVESERLERGEDDCVDLHHFDAGRRSEPRYARKPLSIQSQTNACPSPRPLVWEHVEDAPTWFRRVIPEQVPPLQGRLVEQEIESGSCLPIVVHGSQELREAEPRRNEDDAWLVEMIDVDGPGLHSLENSADQRKDPILGCKSGRELAKPKLIYQHRRGDCREGNVAAPLVETGAVLPVVVRSGFT